MDGAARFNQRDALATILITAINIIAGFLIGVLQQGVPFMEALKTYTVLTVGDIVELSAAIEEQLRRFKAQYGIATQLSTDGNLDDLGSDQQLVLYRVTQEALNNIARHAGASNVAVEIARVDGHVDLEVADDGVGFDVGHELRGLGLDGMAERARLVEGRFEVDAAPGRGTTLRLRVPA